ncbi:MAG: hypothetical protein ACTSVR_03185 [Candidatus Thorarchaeota archaeon]
MMDNQLACSTTEKREIPSQISVLESVLATLENEISTLVNLLETVTVSNDNDDVIASPAPERFTEQGRLLQVITFRFDACVDTIRRLNNKVQL